MELGRRAFAYKRDRYGDRITFVVNRHINPTNLCVYACRFCDFAAKPGDDHAYILSEDDIIAQLNLARVDEVHIVGGLWHEWGFARSFALVRRIRDAHPTLWIKAFTAVEVAYFAKMERTDCGDILRMLKSAGVDALPGGGAEILNPRIHEALHADKIGPAEWLAIHETAHGLGLPTNCTMLFGHIESDEEIVEHLLQLRNLQDRTQGFQSFIPLAYQPGNTGLVPRMVSAPRCLRIVALARLVLDNVPHIKAYWPTLHIETAVTALNFGADDLDGTLGEERVMQLADTQAPEKLSADLLMRMILQAGQKPVRRDGQYREVEPVMECVSDAAG